MDKSRLRRIMFKYLVIMGILIFNSEFAYSDIVKLLEEHNKITKQIESEGNIEIVLGTQNYTIYMRNSSGIPTMTISGGAGGTQWISFPIKDWEKVKNSIDGVLNRP